MLALPYTFKRAYLNSSVATRNIAIQAAVETICRDLVTEQEDLLPTIRALFDLGLYVQWKYLNLQGESYQHINDAFAHRSQERYGQRALQDAFNLFASRFNCWVRLAANPAQPQNGCPYASKDLQLIVAGMKFMQVLIGSEPNRDSLIQQAAMQIDQLQAAYPTTTDIVSISAEDLLKYRERAIDYRLAKAALKFYPASTDFAWLLKQCLNLLYCFTALSQAMTQVGLSMAFINFMLINYGVVDGITSNNHALSRLTLYMGMIAIFNFVTYVYGSASQQSALTVGWRNLTQNNAAYLQLFNDHKGHFAFMLAVSGVSAAWTWVKSYRHFDQAQHAIFEIARTPLFTIANPNNITDTDAFVQRSIADTFPTSVDLVESLFMVYMILGCAGFASFMFVTMSDFYKNLTLPNAIPADLDAQWQQTKEQGKTVGFITTASTVMLSYLSIIGVGIWLVHNDEDNHLLYGLILTYLPKIPKILIAMAFQCFEHNFDLASPKTCAEYMLWLLTTLVIYPIRTLNRVLPPSLEYVTSQLGYPLSTRAGGHAYYCDSKTLYDVRNLIATVLKIAPHHIAFSADGNSTTRIVFTNPALGHQQGLTLAECRAWLKLQNTTVSEAGPTPTVDGPSASAQPPASPPKRVAITAATAARNGKFLLFPAPGEKTGRETPGDYANLEAGLSVPDSSTPAAYGKGAQ